MDKGERVYLQTTCPTRNAKRKDLSGSKIIPDGIPYLQGEMKNTRKNKYVGKSKVNKFIIIQFLSLKELRHKVSNTVLFHLYEVYSIDKTQIVHRQDLGEGNEWGEIAFNEQEVLLWSDRNILEQDRNDFYNIVNVIDVTVHLKIVKMENFVLYIQREIDWTTTKRKNTF